MKKLVLLTCVIVLSYGAMAQQNTLSAQEKKGGWKLLFDGSTTNGWRTFKGDKVGEGWKVAEGVLYLDDTRKEGHTIKDGGNIVTVDEYENFELSVDWKISPCGNSGLIFNVAENLKYNEPYMTGPEVQIIDLTCHPDGKIEKHKTGDLYDLIESKTNSTKPAGEWNTAKLVSDNGHLEIWLNGVKQVETMMYTPEWNALIKGSKFKEYADFGQSRKGRISLQDHGDKVSFRNIKIREIKH